MWWMWALLNCMGMRQGEGVQVAEGGQVTVAVSTRVHGAACVTQWIGLLFP